MAHSFARCVPDVSYENTEKFFGTGTLWRWLPGDAIGPHAKRAPAPAETRKPCPAFLYIAQPMAAKRTSKPPVKSKRASGAPTKRGSVVPKRTGASTKRDASPAVPAPKRTSVAPKRGSRPPRASTAPRASSAPRAFPRLTEAAAQNPEEELGRLLTHCARLEREIAELREASATPLPPHAPSTPPQALSTLTEGLDAMRDVLLAAARELDTFMRAEYDLFDPKVKTLLDVRTVLLRAAGESARVPPPLPSLLPHTIIDISDLAEAVESLRPAAEEQTEKLVIPGPPPVGIRNP